MDKKTHEEQTINCGACGYENCRDIAIAIYNKCNIPENCIQFEKKKVEAESQKNLALSELARQKNEQLATFINNDFDWLDVSISEVAMGNGQTAEETCIIQSTMEDIREFCNEMADSFNSIEDLLAKLETNNKSITRLSKQTSLLWRQSKDLPIKRLVTKI